MSNPIGNFEAQFRKRMGFVIVADTSSQQSFDVAYALVDRIFDRLQFDVSDAIICPVSIVIVGNKADLRASRQVPPEEELREQIQAQYANKANEPAYSVLYVECSAQTNYNLDPIFAESLKRIRMLPSRSRIRTARMRVSGFCGKLKRDVYSCCPFLFDIEDVFKKLNRKYIKPCVRRLGLYAILCECAPLLALFKRIRQAWKIFLTFRWVCSWCPPFVLKLRKEVTADEDDAAVEQLEKQMGAKSGEKENEEDEED